MVVGDCGSGGTACMATRWSAVPASDGSRTGDRDHCRSNPKVTHRHGTHQVPAAAELPPPTPDPAAVSASSHRRPRSCTRSCRWVWAVYCSMLLIAGHVMVTHLRGNAVLCL